MGGVIQRQSLKSSAVLLFGTILGYLNNLIVLPYCLTTEEIGLLRVVISAGTLLGTFAPLGVSSTIVRYFPYFKNLEKKHNGLLPFALLVVGFGATAFILLSIKFKYFILDYYRDNSPLFEDYFVYSLPLLGIFAFTLLFTAYAKIHMRIAFPFFLKQIIQRILIAAVIYTYFLQFIDRQEFFIALNAVYLIILLFLVFYIKNLGVLFLKPDFKYFTSQKIKELFQYGLYAILTGAGTVILANIDTLMLGSLAGLSKTGIYSISFFIGTVIEIPKRVLNKISAPVISQAWKDNNLTKINTLYKKASIHNSIVGFLVFIGVWCNADNIFDLMPKGDIFREGKYVILIIGLSKVMDLLLGINTQIIMNSKYYRFNFYSLIFLVIASIILNYLLIPEYQLIGAAIATTLAIFSYNLVKFLYVKIKFKFSPFTIQTLKLLILATVSFIVGWYFPKIESPLVDILVRSVIITIVYCGLVYFLKISEEVNSMVSKYVNPIFKKQK